MTAVRPGSRVRSRVRVFEDGRERTRNDYLAAEEPLEIRLAAGDLRRTVAVTMRTPGSDFELAAGFLYSEGVVHSRADLGSVRYCTDPDVDDVQRYNIVTVELADLEGVDLRPLERHFFTTSACGVCGKASIDALRLRGDAVGEGPVVPGEVIRSLPDRLRAAQGLFQSTGGLHACGVFDAAGAPLVVREDVGRHNAVDKAIGWALMNGALPLRESVVMVSGRSSYEILQKCLAASAPIVCAVSAPSSLAVSVAEEFGMTLVGFLRNGRFNVYAGRERIGG